MKSLVVEDDLTSKRLLQGFLLPYGPCDAVETGTEAIDLFQKALESGSAYNLVCLDILLPEMDGQEVLKKLRQLEKDKNIEKNEETIIFMTTGLDSPKDVFEAYYHGGCTGYLVKPIEKGKLREMLLEYGLINENF